MEYSSNDGTDKIVLGSVYIIIKSNVNDISPLIIILRRYSVPVSFTEPFSYSSSIKKGNF